jgi:hypothetical protein
MAASAAFLWVLYFLEPMVVDQGLGILPGRCDRLASDEPEAWLTSPT